MEKQEFEKLEKILVAGFGGQGVLLAGKLLAYAGMLDERFVTWIPSYGPEMRGGTANCSVILSLSEIGSPTVDIPTCLIALNKPSMDKFLPSVKPGGMVIKNSSLIVDPVTRDDVEVVEIPLNDLANEIGNSRVLNVIAAGAYAASRKILSLELLTEALKKSLAGKSEKIINLNIEALKKGMEFIQKNR